MAVRYRYLVSDRSLTHDGIPAHDLNDEHVAALSVEQRAVLAASPLYEALKPERASREEPERGTKEEGEA